MVMTPHIVRSNLFKFFNIFGHVLAQIGYSLQMK
jgi:hypothetical protein